jgi:hypothetical protein
MGQDVSAGCLFCPHLSTSYRSRGVEKKPCSARSRARQGGRGALAKGCLPACSRHKLHCCYLNCVLLQSWSFACNYDPSGDASILTLNFAAATAWYFYCNGFKPLPLSCYGLQLRVLELLLSTVRFNTTRGETAYGLNESPLPWKEV